MTSMEQMEKLAEACRHAYDEAEKVASSLEDELEAVKAKYREQIRHAAQQVNESSSALELAVRTHKSLFKKTRSRVIHGIKFGMRKTTESAKVPAKKLDQVRKTVEEKFPFLFSRLFETKYVAVTDQFKKLDEQTLNQLGLTKPKSRDEVIVGPVGSEAKKLIEMLSEGK